MSETPGPPAGHPLVLIVDDNPDLLSTLEMLIVALGGTAMLAATGGAALDQARQRAPDIVLLDIGLPDIDGFEVARRLRGELGLHATYLVGLSGHAEDEERSKAAGFDFHQLKPVPLEALRVILGRRRPTG
jgi:CheY-like chemotaxis protein